MSEQNNYQIESHYKKERGWLSGWVGNYGGGTADTWQEAIQDWLDWAWLWDKYTVVSETPSEDNKSGIIEIQFDPPQRFLLGAKIKATFVED